MISNVLNLNSCAMFSATSVLRFRTRAVAIIMDSLYHHRSGSLASSYSSTQLIWACWFKRRFSPFLSSASADFGYFSIRQRWCGRWFLAPVWLLSLLFTQSSSMAAMGGWNSHHISIEFKTLTKSLLPKCDNLLGKRENMWCDEFSVLALMRLFA